LQQEVKIAMEEAIELKVQLTVRFKVANRWGQLEANCETHDPPACAKKLNFED
jgi:hypothetical protein